MAKAWMPGVLMVLGVSVAAWHPVELRQVGDTHVGCEGPSLLVNISAKHLPSGTIYVNDKSKGMGWLISLASKKSLAVELAYPTGNHESALSHDKTTLAIPSYETARFNDTEGGGIPGDGMTLLDLNTGRARVAPVSPSPFGAAKPHGAAWTANGDILTTFQVKNGIALFHLDPPDSSSTPSVRAFDLQATGCRTPHLVRTVPNSQLVVSGCRCTNAEDPKDCPGHVAIIDLSSGEVKALPSGQGSEGIAVTASGDVWVGGLKDSTVSVFGFGGLSKTIANFKQIGTLKVPFPLRLAYDSVTNTVAIASLDLNAALERSKLRPDSKPYPHETLGEPNLRVFSAGSMQLLKSTVLVTSRRGLVNMEGLNADGGFIFAPGFDTASMAIVDAASLAVVAEIYFPFCTAPKGFCAPTFMSNWETAKAKGYGGWNNWSGGYCPATMRNPWDRRFTTLDGVEFSPATPAWAAGKHNKVSDLVV